MKAYPAYKDSNVDEVGKIPDSWKVIKTKYLFHLVTDKAPPDNEKELLSVYTEIGVKPRKELEQRGNKASTTDGYWIVEKGDIVVNKILAWMGAIGYSAYDGVTSPAYDVLRKSVPLNSRFYHYLFRCGLYLPEFKRRSRGIMEMRLRLYFDELGQIPLVYPPVAEQQTIADFLDRKTAQIDDLIAKKQRQIDLLHEQRTALINQAVTGKLDLTGFGKPVRSERPMKDSGVEWLGKIPSLWNLSRLKFICSLLRDGTHIPPPRHDEGIPLLSVRNIVDGKFINLPDDSLISIEDHKALTQSFEVLENDILLAIVGATLGKVAIVGNLPPFSIQRSLAVFRPKSELCMHKFLAYFFRSASFQSRLWSSVGFSAQPGIYLGTLENIHFPLPTLEEQKKIIFYIEKEEKIILDTVNKAKKQIEFLQEYRTALISAAVTGKIDVREG